MHYGVTYPAEAYKKQVEAGKVKDLNALQQDIEAPMPATTDDIARIQVKLDDLMTKGAPDIVLNSKNDADYQAKQKALIDKLNAAGADQYYQWWLKAFNDTKAKFGG